MKKKTVLVEYSSNNSGGRWWLKDKDWLALEKAGWTVEWGGSYFCHSKYEGFGRRPESKKDICKEAKGCPGHRRYDSLTAVDAADDRWLGCAAEAASKHFNSLSEGIREWESITGMTASDEGCNCCGAPHSFHAGEGTESEYASGSTCADLLLGEPKTLEEAKALIERLRK